MTKAIVIIFSIEIQLFKNAQLIQQGNSELLQIIKIINMSNKQEKQSQGYSIDNQNFSSGQEKIFGKNKNTTLIKDKRTEKIKKKETKKQKSSKKLEAQLSNYEGEKISNLMSILHTEHGVRMPTHYEFNCWRKKLSLLTKSHLPDYFKLFQLQINDSNFCVQRIFPLLSKKGTKDSFLYEKVKGERAFNAKNVDEQKALYLIALEDLAFYTFTKQEFVKFFLGTNQLSEEELSKIAEYLKIRDNKIYWPVAVFQPYNFQIEDMMGILQNFPLTDKRATFLLKVLKNFEEVSQLQVSQNNQKSDPGSLYFRTSSDQKNEELERPEQSQESDLKKEQFPENEDEIQNQSKKQIQKIQNQKSERIEEQIDQSVRQRKSLSRKNSDIQQIEEINKPENEIPAQQFQEKFFIWFIGTTKYIKTDTSLIPWSRVEQEKKKDIFSQKKFGWFTNPINEMIESLNKFYSQVQVELKTDESRIFLTRMCEYSEDNTKYPCIPFRYEIVKPQKIDKIQKIEKIGLEKSEKNFVQQIFEHSQREERQEKSEKQEKQEKNQKSEKKVLIRCYYQNYSELKWVPFQKVKANYLLPRLEKQDLMYLYLLRRQPFSNIMKKFLFREYFFQSKESIHNVFKEYYPEFFVEQQDALQQRCIYCNYKIYNMQFECCYICRKYCHLQCAETKDKVLFDIFGQTKNNSFLWICSKCEPCSVCYQAIGDQYLKCSQCKQFFHHLCGRIKGLNYDSEHLKNTQNFSCQSCLECKMCKKNIKDRDYHFDSNENEFFCSDCNLQLTKNNICHVCMTSTTKNGIMWVQCENCSKWIHEHCDKAAIGDQSKETLRYWCPTCRKKEKRRVFCEVIESIGTFDELQFFTEPSYEKLPLYRTIISQPMCLLKMKDKANEGYYDEKSFEKISTDLNLIIFNALQYNMPKDDAYFQAKILKIMGNRLLEHLQPYFTPSMKQLVTSQVYQQITKARKLFHFQINEHYPEMLLNYQAEKSYIEIKKKIGSTNSGDSMVFSSPVILRNFFKNSSIYFHLKKQKPKIQNLFTMPPQNQNDKGVWRQIKGDMCYYHNCSDIISHCNICCESYCCITECFKHRVCSCGIKGCRCDKFECSCTVQKQKQRKISEKKILQKYYNKNKTARQIIMQITENYKFCYKCAPDTLSGRSCFKCKGLCSWGYSRCSKCHRCWHKKCEEIIKIPNLCSECCKNPQKLNTLEQFLFLDCKAKLLKMAKIQKYLAIITEIYYREGVRITVQQMQELLLNNYDQFLAREKNFRDYELNIKNREIQFDHYFKEVDEETITSLLIKYFDKYNPKAQEFVQHKISNLEYLEKIKILIERNLKIQLQNQTTEQLSQKIIDKVHEQFWRQIHSKKMLLEGPKNGNLKNGQNQYEKAQEMEQQDKKQLPQVAGNAAFKKKLFSKKSSTISELHKFLMSIYEKSKFTLRKGSTCIIKKQKNYCRIIKKWATNQYEISLSKNTDKQIWVLTINNDIHLVTSINDIIEKLQNINVYLQNIKELGQFLGFTIYEPFYKPNHFTHFLQSNLLDEMPLPERMKRVTELYDSYSWGKNGVFTKRDSENVCEYNITKNDIFYLKKKKKGKKQYEDRQKPKAPYISFEDLRKHLEETPILVNKPENTISSKNSMIVNEVFIAPSKIHKLGLFSRKSHKRNTIMIEYIGQIVSESVADLRQQQFHYGCYMFGIGKTTDKKDIIDATFRGNMARYLNHSCDPNCKAKTEYVNNSPRIIIYSIKDIQQYEELTYDYQFNVDAQDKLECTCGAKNCQGRLN